MSHKIKANRRKHKRLRTVGEHVNKTGKKKKAKRQRKADQRTDGIAKVLGETAGSQPPAPR